MRDITEKKSTLRTAKAQSVVRVGDVSIDAINNDKVPKGNIFEMAKVAGFLAVKDCSRVIPHCHPIPIEACNIDYEIKGNDIVIYVEAKTNYKTGIEMEVLYGASVVAITIYDLLKPIDKSIEIINTKLLYKTGGKSDII
ncbi:MAG: cyclic pyranopterin monophosphate synthase MoaC [Marinilabiliales bacterium]